jgi:hypothetical protein
LSSPNGSGATSQPAETKKDQVNIDEPRYTTVLVTPPPTKARSINNKYYPVAILEIESVESSTE